MPYSPPPSSDDIPAWVDPAERVGDGSTPSRFGPHFDIQVTPPMFDPTGAEMAIMDGLRDFRPPRGALYPTWKEVLGLIHGMGYRQSSPR